jgi:uncharacterized protein YgbK (DUF1537 family)
MSIFLGCIADDFTGATDLANNLVRSGMRVVQTIGVPAGPLNMEVDAVVVALKSRTIGPEDAVRQSLDAMRWLHAQGAQQIYFKYCSTFDSTSKGNIGQVTEALLNACKHLDGGGFTVATPAFPDNQRTVFKGYLFVGDVLLNESGMQNHPLTPMVDANLVRVLQAQTHCKVGLIDYTTIAQGEAAIRQRIDILRNDGFEIAIVDAVSNADLFHLGAAVKGLPLVTAGSGLAIGLPQNFGIIYSEQAGELAPARGQKAIVSGSCSLATIRQVQAFQRAGLPSLALDPFRIAAGEDIAREALAWAGPRLSDVPVLIYSTSDASAVKQVQEKVGVEHASVLVEQTLANIALGLVERGVRQLIVAGGETSGACVQALNIAQLKIGQQIDPGVPWCYAHSSASGGEGIHLTLKSGNFGSDDFFINAFSKLQ